MDVIVSLPCIQKGYDLILVIVDRFAISCSLLPNKTVYMGPKLTELCIKRKV
jgi:hypothetical protein